MSSKYIKVKNHIPHIFITPNSCTFDVIETRYEPPYKYVTVNGETRKYLM